MPHPPNPDGTAASANPVHLRRADHNERFVAFAFAGADLLAETDTDGAITFAAGAFRSRFGAPAEAFVGRPIADLVAPSDHDTLDAARAMLVQHGRLLPTLLRIADAERTGLALAGLLLPATNRPLRLCFSFARPPVPLGNAHARHSPDAFARGVRTRLLAGETCEIALLDVSGADRDPNRAAIGQALEAIAPDAVTNEIAPGRFGLLRSSETGVDLLSIANLLEASLRKQGMPVAVAARPLALDVGELTPAQAARALRHALNVFARDGLHGLDSAGFGAGLAGYMRRAGAQTARLRKAIRDRRFDLVFQPIVGLADRVIHHHEALIRPTALSDCGVATPQEFVMLVESVGLADELDLAVVQRAADLAGAAEQAVAVNVSGQSMQSDAFRNRLIPILEAHPARRGGRLLIEMTETAEVEDLAAANATADALRALDITFCLDDFGAGATDIRAFRALRPDVVKLDGSFVPGVVQGDRERALVAGIVEIARSGAAEIVAERVETEAEAAVLQSLGVQFGQGWLFGKPEPFAGQTRAAPTAARRKGVKESWG